MAPTLEGKVGIMNPASYVLVLVFLAAGTVLGWYANRAIAANADVKSTKKKLPGFRKTRKHNGVITIVIAFFVAIIVFDLLRGLVHK